MVSASEPAGLVAALLLGLVSSVASVCCTLPALGLLAGYSGVAAGSGSRRVAVTVGSFCLGTILALMVIGATAGWAGRVAQAALGRSWMGLAGLAAIVLGLATLELLPISLGARGPGAPRPSGPLTHPALAGLLLGGTMAVCSLCCNPGIFVVTGAALLQGAVLQATLLMGAFAVGFAIPLGAALMGLSLGTVSLAARGADRVVRTVSGGLLVIVGFYLLVTL